MKRLAVVSWSRTRLACSALPPHRRPCVAAHVEVLERPAARSLSVSVKMRSTAGENMRTLIVAASLVLAPAGQASAVAAVLTYHGAPDRNGNFVVAGLTAE